MLISGLRPRSESPVTPPIEPAAPSRASCWRVFLVLFGVALAYTSFTGHTWEDYYITYRASKNLATGNGLVFNVGERVHSFTSPLGVLLPAVASVLTGNSSDVGALWIFRVMTMAAYAGAGVLLWRLVRGLFTQAYPALFLVLLLATDAKSIDNATNGMESALVVMFMAWNLWALLRAPKRRAMHLGLAWAGLMWSRPDSFIYVGASAIAVLLFGRFERRWTDRRELIRDCFAGGVLTTAIYGPWILWAWWYYGSPIPHTIVAKGVWMPPITAQTVWEWITHFPLDIFKGSSTLGGTFSPTYAMTHAWPAFTVRISAGLSLVVMAVWLLPFLRWEARVTSFIFTSAHFYLSYVASYPSPWYLPIVTMLGFFTFACLVGQLMGYLSLRAAAAGSPSPSRPAPWVVAGSLLLPTGALLLLLCASWSLRIRQTVVEDANRRAIGEYLRANASSPRATATLECLGYIGYFSNLKIYDYPGLSSPEVVKVLRETKTRADYTHYFPEIVSAYNPEWIVLRMHEVGAFRKVDLELLKDYYHLAKVFDCRQAIEAIKFLPGRNYLRFDSYFEVYRRNENLPDVPGARDLPSALRHRISVATLTTNRALNDKAYQNDGRILAHQPSELATPVPRGATSVMGEFGFYPGAYEEHETKGAVFTVNAVSGDGKRTQLYSRLLKPYDIASDRGQHFFSAPIPMRDATVVEFIIEPPPGQGVAFGWTYWTNLRFHVPDVH
jgi:hypothetical protein